MAIDDCLPSSPAQIFKQKHESKIILCEQHDSLFVHVLQKENCLNAGELPFGALENFVYSLAN